VRDSHDFGGDHRTEVALVAQDHVGLPGHGEDLGRTLAGGLVGESSAQVGVLTLAGWREQGTAGGAAVEVRATSLSLEARGDDSLDHALLAREQDGVSCEGNRPGNREQWVEVSSSTHESRQDSHALTVGGCFCGCR
jgi:hypothetical protein